MNVFYISPSTIPSRSANTVHVINMCRALTEKGLNVTLFIKANVKESKGYLLESFGLDAGLLEIVTYKLSFKRGTEIFLSLKSLLKYFSLEKRERVSVAIISRNIYAALIFGVFLRKNIIYETHAPENGFRKWIQALLIKKKNVNTVVISGALRSLLISIYKRTPENMCIMHDAAFNEGAPLSRVQRHDRRREVFKELGYKIDSKYVAGYFGHLYPGRGIEIIQEIARINDAILFLVFGGNEADVTRFRSENKSSNLIFMGYVEAKDAKKAMSMMDVLLMPYQESVSVGLKNVDTAQWMSPMKMFEYMSVGVPIISSDLPVLREVLADKRNSLLVEPGDASAWSAAINELLVNEPLSLKISSTAYDDFINDYTWGCRVEKMLTALGCNDI